MASTAVKVVTLAAGLMSVVVVVDSVKLGNGMESGKCPRECDRAVSYCDPHTLMCVSCEPDCALATIMGLSYDRNESLAECNRTDKCQVYMKIHWSSFNEVTSFEKPTQDQERDINKAPLRIYLGVLCGLLLLIALIVWITCRVQGMRSRVRGQAIPPDDPDQDTSRGPVKQEIQDPHHQERLESHGQLESEQPGAPSELVV